MKLQCIVVIEALHRTGTINPSGQRIDARPGHCPPTVIVVAVTQGVIELKERLD